MTRILVIGQTGQVARALAHLAGAHVTFAGRDRLDLAQPERIAPLVAEIRPEIIVNAAAYTAVDKAESERDLAFAINADAVTALAEEAAAHGAGLIHLSTDYVFDGTSKRPYREDDPTDPVNTYGASKLAGETGALAASPRVAILRTSWVYAPWGKNFVRTMLGLAGREELPVVADQHGQPTSALSIAAACLAIVPRLAGAGPDDPAWGVYHYAGAGPTTWAAFAEEIFAQARTRLIAASPKIARITTAGFPTPAKRPANSALNCTKFETAFGIATVPWKAALRQSLDLMEPA